MFRFVRRCLLVAIAAVAVAGCDLGRLAALDVDDIIDAALASVGVETPRFAGTVAVIEEATADRMTSSWREGCPVPLEDLRLVTVSHWGYDGGVHTGELVVHVDHAADILAVMEELFATRYPMERMELVDVYGGDDDASMAANNTSAFNCREVAGRPGVWSQHAYGLAIDVNPLVNPYVRADGKVVPPQGASFTDRSRPVPGLIVAGDTVVTAFESIGWTWGGTWRGGKDYQHFSASGR